MHTLNRVIILAYAGAVAALSAVALGPQRVEAQAAPSDSARAAAATAARRMVFLRAQRMVNDGNGTEGRALLDSLLNETPPRSAEEAEVLFWRATIAESWDQAERDYLRVMLQHEGSPRAAFAMLRLAQGELTRGDRDAALRYLERLATESPDSPLRAEGALWQGRILLDRGTRVRGCEVLRDGRARVSAGSLELENQYDYLLRTCPPPSDSAIAATPPAQPPPGQPAQQTPQTPQAPAPAQQPAAPAPVPVPSPPATGPMWSVQIAAWPTRDEADRFLAAVRGKGYDARIDGDAAPFRVRFGRYATRDAASAAMAEYRQKERADAFLVQVPR